MLGATALLWRLIEAYGPRSWKASVTAWNRLRASAFARRLRGMALLGPLLNHTLTAARYLGVYALLGFLVALGSLAAFFELADEIGVDEGMARFDTLLSLALGQHLTEPMLGFFVELTRLGNSSFLIPLAAVVAAALLIAQQRLLACAWIIATASNALLNLLLKSIFERARPTRLHELLNPDGWSFPSGHASGSMMVYGLLGYLVIRLTPRMWHLPVAMLCVLLIVFVGFSRVLLQVHFLSDVLAGYASAAAWGALCIAGLEAVRRRRGRAAEGASSQRN